MLRLPATMDEVTPEWLQAAVSTHLDFAGARIERIEKTPVGVGIGQVGDLARVTLTYADDVTAERKFPASVVVKLQAGFEPMRAVGVRYDMYLRETGFYQTLAKATRAPTPTIYFIDWQPAQERNTIVMQDLTQWHWPDQIAGATSHQAERCIDARQKAGTVGLGGREHLRYRQHLIFRHALRCLGRHGSSDCAIQRRPERIDVRPGALRPAGRGVLLGRRVARLHDRRHDL